MLNLDTYDGSIILKLIDKKRALELINTRLAVMANGDETFANRHKQGEYNNLQRVKHQLIADDSTDKKLQMLKEQLIYSTEMLMKAIDKRSPLTSFYDIRITINGIDHTLPLNADLHVTLVGYIDIELDSLRRSLGQ